MIEAVICFWVIFLFYINTSCSCSCQIVRNLSATLDGPSHSLLSLFLLLCFLYSCFFGFLKNIFCLTQHAALSEYRPILANRTQTHSFTSMADMKLTLIPIIFIVLRIWSTVRFILLLAGSSARQNPVLVTLHVSFFQTSAIYSLLLPLNAASFLDCVDVCACYHRTFIMKWFLFFE